MLQILNDIIVKAFQTLIPITIFYAIFVYIINRDTQELRKQQKNDIENKLPQNNIIPNNNESIKTIISHQIITKATKLKYLKKPLHNKVKNKQLTQKLKHKNRYDKRLNFRG